MAIKLHTGLLNKKVSFQKPTEIVNDEGGRELAYSLEFDAFCHVKEVSQNRSAEPQGTAITNAKDFYIRYAAARVFINENWRIVYDGAFWTVFEVERMMEGDQWIRVRAKRN